MCGTVMRADRGAWQRSRPAYITHAAGQPRNDPVMNGALIEILKAAGLLKEAGELVGTFDEDFDDASPVKDETRAEPREEAPRSSQVSAVIEPGNKPANGPYLRIHLARSLQAGQDKTSPRGSRPCPKSCPGTYSEIPSSRTRTGSPGVRNLRLSGGY